MENHTSAVRNLAQTVAELAAIDVPELDRSEEMRIDDEYYDLEQDQDWWDAWCEAYETVESLMGSAEVGDSYIRPDVEKHRQYDEIIAETAHTSLSVQVYADGDIEILAEYNRGNWSSWDVLFSGRVSAEEPDLIEIGRAVASAELGYIASRTGSSADTVDYWQTELAPNAFTQQRWGNIRGVGRQTVNDHVRRASRVLTREFGPNNIHRGLNDVEPGYALDFAFIQGDPSNVVGGGTFRVAELIERFGNGNGHIRCKNQHSDVVTDIKEMEREEDERVAIHQDGELAHIGGHLMIDYQESLED